MGSVVQTILNRGILAGAQRRTRKRCALPGEPLQSVIGCDVEASHVPRTLMAFTAAAALLSGCASAQVSETTSAPAPAAVSGEASPASTNQSAKMDDCDMRAQQLLATVPKSFGPADYLGAAVMTPLNPVGVPVAAYSNFQEREAAQRSKLAEIEQDRQQCHRQAEAAARQREQQARDEEYDRTHGYRHISVETFVLDGKDLAARAAKVSLSGAYLREGNVEVLYDDSRAVILATHSGNAGHQPKVALLTDDASREFRQLLLRCQSNAGSAQVGCSVTALGHATMCTLSNVFGAARRLPCVAVEAGRQ
jgi:hypothetical protein